jgi:YD repeat-containing protein
VYDVDPGSDVPYPSRGLVVTDQYDADGQRSLTTTRWGLSRAWGPDLKAIRLDQEETTYEDCLLGTGTTPTCIGVPVKSYTLVESRDSHGYPTVSHSGDADEKVTTVKGRVDRIGPWVLGLVTDETIQGRRYLIDGTVQEGRNLSSIITTYDSIGRMLTRTVPRMAPDDCNTEVGSLTDSKLDILSFDQYGNIVTAVQNGLTTTRTYDDLYLYPKTVTATVTTYVDGVASGQSALTSSRSVDLRTGELWSTKDANGALTEVRRDARGRPTVEVNPNGVVVAEHVYRDQRTASENLQHIETRFTSNVGGIVTKTDLNGAGRVLKAVTYTKSLNLLSSPTRVEFHALDSSGRQRRSYLPALTAANPASRDPHVARAFDSSGRVISTRVPDGTTSGRVTTWRYAPRSKIVTDPLAIETTVTTDWRGEVVSLKRSAGTLNTLTTYKRDGLGRLGVLTNADGDVQTYEHDDGGRLYRYTLPYQHGASGAVVESCYDGRGTLVRSRDPENREVRNKADEAGRLVKRLVGDHANAQQLIYTTSYDEPSADRFALGRAWRSTGPAGTTEFTYDARGLPVITTSKITASIGGYDSVTSTQAFGLQGELKKTSTSGQLGSSKVVLGSFTYDRDARGRVKSISDGSTEIARPIPYNTSGNLYDAFDRVPAMAIGQPPAIPGQRSTARWRWHSQSQDLLEIVYKRPGRLLNRIVFDDYQKDGSPRKEDRDGTIDASGNHIVISKGWGYDELGRLAEEVIKKNGTIIFDEQYTYSLAGRMLTAGRNGFTTYTYANPSLPGAVTLLSTGSIPTRNLTYDAAGNLKTSEAATDVGSRA